VVSGGIAQNAPCLFHASGYEVKLKKELLGAFGASALRAQYYLFLI
jgi:hypothetical protein